MGAIVQSHLDLNDLIVVFLGAVKYFTSKLKQLYFNPVLKSERGYMCFRF